VPNAVAHRARSLDAGRLTAVVHFWQTGGRYCRHRPLSVSGGEWLQHLPKLPINEFEEQGTVTIRLQLSQAANWQSDSSGVNGNLAHG
jgi:hypothetical protein